MAFSSIVGIGPGNRVWFKSDHYLTDITEFKEFRTTCYFPSIFGIIPGSYGLLAKADNKNGIWNRDLAGYYRELGRYSTRRKASLALEEIMQLKGIEEI